MKAYYGSKISEHMTVTPEGYLICLSVPIARIGEQDYLSSELGVNDSEPNQIVKVHRTEDEVFAQATIASFEGKPVTDDHPNESVTPHNITAYDCGHVQNVRRGVGDDSDLLIADLFVTNSQLIDAIKAGRREVSCGYECDYVQDEDGNIYQRAIRGNHVAVVENGRAGHRVAIKDASPKKDDSHTERGKRMAKNTSLFARLFSRAVRDMEPEEIADAIEEMANTAEAINAEKKQDAEPVVTAPAAPVAAPTADEGETEVLAQLIAAVAKLTEKVETMCKPAQPADEDPIKQLEDELTAAPEVNKPVEADACGKDEDPEEALTVPAEEIEADEDGTETEVTIPADEDTVEVEVEKQPTKKEAALAALNAVKPVIASLPPYQRKAAADKAVTEIRKLMGKPEKATSNGYVGIANTMRQNAKRKAADSKKVADNGELGRSIMASRNPHYKKEA